MLARLPAVMIPPLEQLTPGLKIHKSIPNRKLAVTKVCHVHDIPSGEVRMVPPLPTATNCVPDQATPFRVFVVPDVRDVTGIPGTAIGTELNPPITKLEPGAALGMTTPGVAIPTITRRFPAVTPNAGTE